MPEYKREDGARFKEVIARVNAGAAVGLSVFLGVGSYLAFSADDQPSSGSANITESLDEAAPPSAADAGTDIGTPVVSGPPAEGQTGRAAVPNLVRPERPRSPEEAARQSGTVVEAGDGSRAVPAEPASRRVDGSDVGSIKAEQQGEAMRREPVPENRERMMQQHRERMREHQERMRERRGGRDR